MSDNSSKQHLDSNQIVDTKLPEWKHYNLGRRAPNPPTGYAHSYCDLKHQNANNSHFLTYSYIDYTKNTPQDTEQCLASVRNKIVKAERQYISKLKLFREKLGVVSTTSCNKLPLLEKIIDLHSNILLEKLLQHSSPLDIPKILLKHGSTLKLYVKFSKNRQDFSYLVMDVCENIIDHFKARLLEYNFTLSEIRSLSIANKELKTACDGAESKIKRIYQDLVSGLVTPKIEII